MQRAQAVDGAVDSELALYRPLDLRAPAPPGNRRQAVGKPPGGLASAIAHQGLPRGHRGDEIVLRWAALSIYRLLPLSLHLSIGAGGAHRADDLLAIERIG